MQVERGIVEFDSGHRVHVLSVKRATRLEPFAFLTVLREVIAQPKSKNDLKSTFKCFSFYFSIIVIAQLLAL